MTAENHDDEIPLDALAAGRWYGQFVTANLKTFPKGQKAKGIDKLLRRRLTGNDHPRWILASKSNWENWAKGRVARSETRKSRRYLQAFYDVFGVDLSKDSVISNSLTNHVVPLAKLGKVSAYRLPRELDANGHMAFQISFERLEFEPIPQKVFARDFGLPGTRGIGSVQYGILKCHLTVLGNNEPVELAPLIELLSDGRPEQFGKCIGFSVKWDAEMREWTLVNRAGNTWILGSLEHALLCEVMAKPKAQIWLRVEVAREDLFPVFSYNILETFPASDGVAAEKEAPNIGKPENSESAAREKLIAQVLQQRLTPRKRYELSVMRIVLE